MLQEIHLQLVHHKEIMVVMVLQNGSDGLLVEVVEELVLLELM